MPRREYSRPAWKTSFNSNGAPGPFLVSVYVLADIAHEKATGDASLRYDNGDITSDAEQQLVRQADYTWTVANDLADFNWRSRAATAEQTFADAEAQRNQDALASQASSQTEAIVEQAYSLGTAQAQQTEDLALADAQRPNILDQTTADNAQRGSDAAGNAAFLSAQYAAKTLAMQTLVSDLGYAPWALYQQARAAAQEAAWDGTGPAAVGAGLPTATLAAAYLSWQQQVSAAYSAYANARATAYFSSATDIANRTYADAQYSANRTAQEVGTLAGDEQSFETQLATKVSIYRTAMDRADQVYYDAEAVATRDQTGFDDDAYQTWSNITDDVNGSAATTYDNGYVTLDGQRRHDMATEGLNFVTDLAGAASTAANAIAQDQAGFDTAAANAYFVGQASSLTGSGLEFTLASLAQNYDINYATTFANALSNLAGGNLGASWSSWAQLAAVDAQTQLTAVDIPSANAAFAQRIAQAVTDNAANIAAGVADRVQWLSDLATNSSQAISAAQVALASANAGGDASSVSAPGDLAPPTNLDLGAVAVAALGSFGVGGTGGALGGWTGDRGDGGYTPAWGDPFSSIYVYGGYYNWFGSGAYGWGTGYYNSNLTWSVNLGWTGAWWNSIGYGWWGGAGLSFPSGVSDPFDTGITSSTPPTPVDPTAVVTQEQAEVNTLSTLATVGKDVIAILKNAAPVAIQAASGLAQLGAGAGFAGFALATDGATADGQDGADPKPRPLTQAEIDAVREFGDHYNDLVEKADDGDMDAEAELDQIERGDDNPVTLPDAWTAATAFNEVSGSNWDGRTVLEIIKVYAANLANDNNEDAGKESTALANFVAQHVHFGAAVRQDEPTSVFSHTWPFSLIFEPDPRVQPKDPSITITGYGNREIKSVADFQSLGEEHVARLDVGIPAGWDSTQVAQYILKLIADNPIVNAVVQDEFAGRYPRLYGQLQADAFDSAAAQASLIIGTYYKMLVGIVPGGSASLAVFAVGQGDFFGAGLEVLFMGPVLKLAGAAAGFVAVKVGEKIVSYIPVSAIKTFQGLGAAERETLLAGLRAAKTEEEAAVQLAKILKRCGGENGLAFATGRDGEVFLKHLLGGGVEQVRFEARMLTGVRKSRYIDILKDAIANESKVGYVEFKPAIREEIEKDAWLLKNNPKIEGVEWHFFRSAETGKIGADPRILKMLDDNGIKYHIYAQ